MRLHFLTKSSRSVLIITVSSACNKQCMMLIIGSETQFVSKNVINSSMKNMKRSTDEAAPCRIPEVVQNSSDAYDAFPIIHVV